MTARVSAAADLASALDQVQTLRKNTGTTHSSSGSEGGFEASAGELRHASRIGRVVSLPIDVRKRCQRE